MVRFMYRIFWAAIPGTGTVFTDVRASDPSPSATVAVLELAAERNAWFAKAVNAVP